MLEKSFVKNTLQSNTFLSLTSTAKPSESTPLLENGTGQQKGRLRPSYTHREQVTCLTPTPEQDESFSQSNDHRRQSTDGTRSEPSFAAAGRGLQGSVLDAAMFKTETIGDLSLSLEEDIDLPIEESTGTAASKPCSNEIENSSERRKASSATKQGGVSGNPPTQGLWMTLWPQEFRSWRKHK